MAILSSLKSPLLPLLSLIIAAGCAMHLSPRSPGGRDVVSSASVRGHLEFLAGDALNGRGSGTRDEWIAASYAGSVMRRAGLQAMGDDGGYVQMVEIERREIASPPILTIGSDRLPYGRDMLVQNMTAPDVSGPLWRFRAGEASPRGAVVLLPEGAPSNATPASSGAAFVLAPETPQVRARWDALAGRTPTITGRLPGVSPQPAAPPFTVMLSTAAHASASKLPEGTRVTIEAPTKAPQRTRTWNALGRLQGTDVETEAEVILLSAHLDHLGNRSDRPKAPADALYNGADDDASGSVAVLELMDALTRGKRPKRTLIFALFGSEEDGGFGSRFFAYRPVVSLTRIVANLQFEMIGRSDPKLPRQTLWLTGYERSNLGPALARRGARLVQDPHPDQNFFERSDNIQFARRGVVAHTVSSFGLHREYHTPDDEVHLIDLAHMTEAIRSMIEPIRWLANAEFRPEWVAGKKP